MNITLMYKWGRDPEEIFVYDDGSTKLRRDRLVASDDDAAAIVSARNLARETNGELVAATIGSGDASWAMARGAARGVSVSALMPAIDNAVTAEELAQAVHAAGDNPVVVMGDAREAIGVAGTLAALLGMTFVAGAMDFAVCPDDASKILVRRKNGKAIETLRVSTPVLISVAATEGEKNVPSIKDMLAAKKAPLEKIDAAPIAQSAVRETAYRRPELHRATIFEGTAAEAADALAAALRADGVL